ncbi:MULTISPECIES: hypothetical protein [unclassified Facklamia]|uniref:hypothetical protein n=1 Tax=Aerococcaceae TaxID=186827 RepID=UPI0013BE4F7D|nr:MULTISPECIES: hypothetical protein [unclassified Facklamia]NEW65282.1 hypothetical protein [Facklamia sp. 252]NEW68738.1 hypothetical protein [Facklamia sp. 253]QQD66127.1 hypothetical protein JDW14_03200 [Aerococcaceae bacterium zg-252]
MRAKEKVDLWWEVLHLSSLPVEEIDDSPRVIMLRDIFYKDSEDDSRADRTRYVKFECDRERLDSLISKLKLTKVEISLRLGKNRDYLTVILRRGRAEEASILEINEMLNEEVLKICN